MSESQFKVTMRGYDRETVDAYIAKAKADSDRELAELRAKLEAAAAEKETLTTQLQEGESLRGEMQSAMTGAQEFINAQAAKLKMTERGLEEAKKKNALYLEKQDALTKLLADAQIKCAKLVEEAQQHGERIVAEAEKQKSEILDKATASAAHIVNESKQDADAVQSALRDRFSTIIDTVSAIRQLTSQVSACCDAADQMIAEPDSFFYSEIPESTAATV